MSRMIAVAAVAVAAAAALFAWPSSSSADVPIRAPGARPAMVEVATPSWRAAPDTESTDVRALHDRIARLEAALAAHLRESVESDPSAEAIGRVLEQRQRNAQRDQLAEIESHLFDRSEAFAAAQGLDAAVLERLQASVQTEVDAMLQLGEDASSGAMSGLEARMEQQGIMQRSVERTTEFLTPDQHRAWWQFRSGMAE